MTRQQGETHTATSLTEDQVREIRRLRAPCDSCGSSLSMRTIGDRFGISAVQVFNIVHRKAWAHVE